MKLLHRLSALAMTAVMAFSITGGVFAADAAMATIDTSLSSTPDPGAADAGAPERAQHGGNR